MSNAKTQIVGLTALTFLLIAGPARATDGFLTEHEAEFFAAYGLHAQVDGKGVKRPAEPAKWADVARRAPQPLRQRLQRLVAAMERGQVTEPEKAEFGKLMQEGQAKMQGAMMGAIFGALLGEDPFDGAVRATDTMMKEGKVKEAWDMQRKWLERSYAARQEADKELDAILGDVKRRSSSARSAEEMALRTGVDNQKLVLKAYTKAGFTQPLVQVLVHRKSTNGQWTGTNVLAGGITRALGVEGMDASAQVKGTALAAAQEKMMNLPLLLVALLPDLADKSQVVLQVGLPAEAALGVERIEARILSKEGWLVVDDVPGLAETQKLAAAAAEEARKKAQAAARRPFTAVPPRPGSRPGFPPTTPPKEKSDPPKADAPPTKEDPEKLADGKLKLARELFAGGQKEDGVEYCEQIVKRWPDTEAAKEARALLKQHKKP